MQPYDANGLNPLSYWSYVQDVVNRYKNSPALGMWEPISEPEASACPHSSNRRTVVAIRSALTRLRPSRRCSTSSTS